MILSAFMDVDALVKRGIDLAGSCLGLIFLSPLFIVIMIALKLNDGGPIFYQATRVGQYGIIFKLFKFRSMVVNADQIGSALTGAQDTRITSIGRFLRRTKLDELPQLWNVLKGDMSLVGPRPEDPKYVALYTAEQRRILAVRPGMTSPASLAYRDEESMLVGNDWEQHYVEIILPKKLAIDLAHLENANFLVDLYVIVRTLFALFR